MSEEKFIIDTNCFLEPYKNYLPFEVAPGFYKAFKEVLKQPNVFVLDKVIKEIKHYDDELFQWLKQIDLNVIKTDDAILENYGLVLNKLEESGFFKDESLAMWTDENKADPFLISAAYINNLTVITQEVPVKNLNKKNPMKKEPKISNACSLMNVKFENLRYFFIKMKVKF